MTKLITAEEARNMRDMSLIHFVNNDLNKYIKHINKMVNDATSEGKWNYQAVIQYYPDAKIDKVLEELSYEKMKVLINHLKENGYQAMIYGNVFYLSWALEEKEEVKEEPKKKSLWDIVWNH